MPGNTTSTPNKITEQVRAGENFFVAGERYYGPFLYPRLIALYGLLTGKVQLNADGTVPTGQIYWFFVIQSLVFGAALVAFFLALTTIVSSRIAAMAAAFLALEPILVQFSAQMLTETLFIAFMLLAISVFIFTLRVKPEESATKILATVRAARDVAGVDVPPKGQGPSGSWPYS